MRPFLSILLALAALSASLGSGTAWALDPARSVAQYKHTHWGAEDGAPAGVLVLAQGRSGYLWVGTRSGLYRFDGISFERIFRQGTTESPSVTALMVSAEGDVWVGYATHAGVATSVFRRGILQDVAMPDSDEVMDFVQTRDGSIWATLGRKVKHLMRFQQGRWTEVGTALGFPDENLGRMVVDRAGTIWVSTEAAVWFLRHGAGRFEKIDEPTTGFGGLAIDAHGNVWLSDKSGSRVVSAPPHGSRISRSSISYPVPGHLRNVKSIFDRDGNMWGRGGNGIFRVRTPRLAGPLSSAEASLATTHYQKKDGLSSDLTYAIFEDREGNLWIGTDDGLDRFRDVRVVIEPRLTKRAAWGDVLLGAADGTVYIGEADAVYRVKPRGNPEVLLHAEQPLAICEGLDRAVWIVFEGFVARVKNDRIARFKGPPTSDDEITDCAVDRRGRLWIAATRDGLFGRVNGTWLQILVPPAQGGFPPRVLLRTRRNQILIGFEDNSLAIADPPEHVRLLFNSKSRMGKVRTLFEAGSTTLLGTGDGIGLLKDGYLRVLSKDRFPALRNVNGFSQTDAGATWMISSAGIVSTPTAALLQVFANRKAPLSLEVLDGRDGLPGSNISDTLHAVAKGGDGRLWFSTRAGTVWVDPARLKRNTVPPPVAIATLRAGRLVYPDAVSVQLPAGTDNLQIGYAVPSLSIPERVRVLYKLEGADHRWVDPGMRRQAFYTNLRPGHYSFRVVAANDDGVWNRTGAVLEFDIPPTFLQSGLFKALCSLVIGLLLWCLYVARIRQLTAKMRGRLEERLAERERIARDLHDTLLQGFQGLIIRFQSVANTIPEGLHARKLIEQTLDTADDILRAGRDSVQHLRATDGTDLSQGFSETAKSMRVTHPVQFDMVIEGTTRELHPVVREELYRIGNEALINAFRHAKASSIELAITYEDSGLALGVRDDGVGIQPEILEHGGRQGHFGLVGMRERARQIEGDLTVSSRPGGGTEVRVTVPSGVAYAERSRGAWWRRSYRAPPTRLRRT